MSTGRVIRMGRTWTLGSSRGAGNFGEVFEARDENGESAAIKLVPRSPRARREMLVIPDIQGVPNVVPIIESGEDGNDYVIVMPLADRSLQDELDARGGRLPTDEAVRVLTDMATALAGVSGKVIHRDIKPDNVLLLNGGWYLADFGIAKFAAAATEPGTFKPYGTDEYKAPERFLGHTASPAVDVYALGILGFEILTGRLPFNGPDFFHQHLQEDVPPLRDVPDSLASVIADCVNKAAGSRPAAAQVLARLRIALTPATGGAAALQAANRTFAEEQTAGSAKLAAARSAQEERRLLRETAERSLGRIIDSLDAATQRHAPDSALTTAATTATGWARSLGPATLFTQTIQEAMSGNWGGWTPPFDIVAFTSIGVRIPADQHGYVGRSHSLWYCDAHAAGEYRWFETGFAMQSLSGLRSDMEPLALSPGPEAREAIGPGLGSYQVVRRFTPIDQGEEADFIDRWLGWLAAGFAGDLRFPSNQPEHPDAEGSWRR